MTRPHSGFVTHWPAPFQECGPPGHVNNAVYPDYIEQAAIDHATTGSPAGLQSEAGAALVAGGHVAGTQIAMSHALLFRG